MRAGLLSVLSLAVVVTLSASALPDISLSLEPDSAVLDVAEVSRGAVAFIATITNGGSETVTVAHPLICLPEGFTEGDVKRPEDSHGKSEILLTVVRPDGDRVTLRDGWFGFFDPGNVDHLVIPPGESSAFRLGWFFPNARGRWEDDATAWTIFSEPGTYTARVIIRNEHPTAHVRDQTTHRVAVIDVWTGELQSNEASLEIRPSTD